MPSLLIAADDAALRTRIRGELERRDFSVVGEARTVKEAVELAIQEAPDVSLVDLRLPGNGLAAVAQIVKAVPATSVVVLAEANEASDVVAVLERGASGYLLKSMGGDELAASLRAAASGEPALSRALVPLLVYQVLRGSRRRVTLPSGAVSLTAREWEIGELLRDGHATREIAVRLGLSPVTVRRHVGLLVKKLGAENRAAAVEALRQFAR